MLRNTRRYLLLFSFVLFQSNIAQSQSRRAALSFSCEAESPDGTLVVDSEGKQFALSEFVFPTTSFVDSAVYCKRWLRETLSAQLPADYPLEISLESEALVGSSDLQAIRLKGAIRSLLYSSCRRSSICSLRFPYFFLGLDNKTALSSTLESLRAGESFRPQCKKTPLQSLRSLKKLEPRAPLWTFGQETRWWVSPESSFATELLNEIKSKKAKIVVASSMTISKSVFNSLLSALDENPDVDLILILSLPHLLSEDDFNRSILAEKKRSNLFLLPIFPTPSKQRNYHIKGFVSDRHQFSFTSANISSQESQSALDLGFSGNDPEKAGYFWELFFAETKAACSDELSLSCTLEASLGPSDPARLTIKENLLSACRRLHHTNLNSLATPGFVRNSEFDLESWMQDEIKGAQTQLTVFTHQFDHSGIRASLESRAKAIPVNLWVGALSSSKELARQEADGLDLRWNNTRRFLQPHSKGLYIDRTKLILCTGNFTQNGLVDSAEACLMTESTAALMAIRRYLATASDYLLPTNNLPAGMLESELTQRRSVFVPASPVRKLPWVKKWMAHFKLIEGSPGDFLQPPSMNIQQCLPKEDRFFDYIDSYEKCSVETLNK